MLTDNGTHFTEPSGNARTLMEIKILRAETVFFRCYSFDRPAPISHRTSSDQAAPSVNKRSVERMNRIIKTG